MNTRSNALLDEDPQFDRLVDGALSTAEYKSFLASLEDEPDGWRRCAIAFLEAQAWGREFAAIRRVEEDCAPRTDAKQPVELRSAKKANSSAGPLLAAAVCAVLAFGLGLASRQFFSAERLPALAGQAPPGTVDAPSVSVATDDVVERPEFTTMNLVIDGASNQEVVVPVIAGAPGTESLVETEPAIPDSVLRALRLRGHDIQRQQQFIPVATGDGRHVIFPVEQYKITPVSSRSY